jgi:hypothetical protein
MDIKLKKFYAGVLLLMGIGLSLSVTLEWPELTAARKTPPPVMELLRVSNVTSALYDAGLDFYVAHDYGADFAVSGLTPVLVTFRDERGEETGDKVLIYESHSLPEYENLIASIYLDGALDDSPGLAALGPGNWQRTTLTGKNLLLIYLSRSDLLPLYMERQAQNLAKLNEVAAERLNRVRRVFYLGEGEHWAARIIMDYYHHVWIDENGAEEPEFYFEQMLGLKSLAADDETLPLRLTLISGEESSNAEFAFDPARADGEGYNWYAGLSGYQVFDLQAPFTLVVTWEDQKEELALTLYVEDGDAQGGDPFR